MLLLLGVSGCVGEVTLSGGWWVCLIRSNFRKGLYGDEILLYSDRDDCSLHT